MNDDISNYSKIPGTGLSVRNQAARNDKVAADDASSRALTAPQVAAAAPGDTVELSESARLELAAEQFNRAKVEAIKQALQNGQYPLDSRRIAENFYAIESLIKG
jgi:flagellar biosynthesis anti-sigma factor FlgM